MTVPPQDNALRDYIDLLAEQRCVVYLTEHRVKTCRVSNCGVCAEMSEIKAETIVSVRNSLLHVFWKQVLETQHEVDDSGTIYGFSEVLRLKLKKLGEAPVSDLW